jgi:hypothetical protein
MQTCCSQLGNGTAFVQDGCTVWCDVSVADAFGDFSDCLQDRNNSNTIYGLSCSNEDTKLANETSSGDDDTSGSGPAYDSSRATVIGVLCGVLALSALYL